jgi:Transposase
MKGSEAGHQLFSWRQVFFQPHPGARPGVQIAAIGGCIGGRRRGRSSVYFGSLRLENRPRHGTAHDSKPMPSPSRVCLQHARFGAHKKSIEVDVRARVGSAAVCSGCHRPAPGYDHLPERRFEIIPLWGFLVSWKETAESFHTSWDKVCDAVESVVTWGLEHRTLASIRAIGVDEIQYAKGRKYLTLVYQIDQGFTRLLWVGKERTLESFRGFFTVIGEPLASQIEFVCSDMWQPYWT